MKTICLADERSTNFVDCYVCIGRDYDGLLTGTVIWTGLPVAYITHPDSNYGDASELHGHKYCGIQSVITDDKTQQQLFAHFTEWYGGAAEGFAAAATEIISRDNGSMHVVFDELDHMLDDGHEWIAFMENVQDKIHVHYPDEFPAPSS